MCRPVVSTPYVQVHDQTVRPVQRARICYVGTLPRVADMEFKVTDRPSPLRVPVPAVVICTICKCAVPDDDSVAADLMGRQQDDEDFLVVLCDQCSTTHVFSEGGDA